MNEAIKLLRKEAKYHLSRAKSKDIKSPDGGVIEKYEGYHTRMVDEYNNAIRVLSGKYTIRDWMVGLVIEFDDFDKAESNYTEIVEHSLKDGGECDVQLFVVFEETCSL